MKIVLVKSPHNQNSLAALCAAVEASYEDQAIELIEEKEVVDYLKNSENSKETILAFSFQTADVFRLEKLITQIKTINDATLLIAGGAHPSGAPDHSLKMGFDYVFVGEGEEVIVDFLKRIKQGKKPNEKIIKSKPVDITRYLSISEKYRAFGPIEITRGCPFGCYYCQTTYLFGKMRHRTTDQIITMAKILVNSQRPNIRFVSPNLLSYGSSDGRKINLDRLEKMLASVRAVNGVKKIFAGSFPSEIRPEQLNLRALKIIKRYCHNDNLIIGAQSGSDSMLKKCHRGHSIADVRRAIEMILEFGFSANVDFIFGLPGETKAEEKATIQLIKELVNLDGVRIHGHAFLPLPGTPWVKEKPGRISPSLREFLKDLKRLGKEYGDWEEQEKLGRNFSRFKV